MSPEKLIRNKNLQLIFGVTVVAVGGIASITPAFPRIVEDLKISTVDVGMLIVAFTIPTIIISPFVGILADRFGRKRLLVPSLFLFGLGGGACAFTTDFNTILILRVFQGAGGAGTSSLSLAIIGDLFTGERRAEAMGFNASVLSSSTAAYPLIGGALATVAWNYPFYLAFLGVFIGFLVIFFLDNTEPQSSGNIKEYLTRTLGYLKNIKVWSVFIAGIVAFIILFGAALTYFALYMGDKFDASPFIIGVIISVNSIATVVVAMQLGKLTKIFSLVNLVKLGFVLSAVAMAMVPLLPHLMLLIIPSAIFGVGFGIIFPCIHTYVAGLVPSSYRAVFMSVNTAMFQLGKTLGPLVVGVAYVYGSFNGAFYFSAGLAVVTAVIGVVGGRFIR